MGQLMKAFFFKISKDIAFRVTLIVGGVLALMMTGIYALLQGAMTNIGEGFENMKFLTGETMLLTSFSPLQNFGFAIPINLVIFTYLEFTQGTIRNKIIAGHSKFEIYSSLYLSGLVYAFALLLAYVGICTALGSIFGGFDPNGAVMAVTNGGSGGYASPEYIIKFVVVALITYTSIVSFTVFIVTTFRNIGPSLPLIIIVPFILYFVALFANTAEGVAREIYLAEVNAAAQGAQYDVAAAEQSLKAFETINNISKCVNPYHAISVSSMNSESKLIMDDMTFYGGLANNIVWAALFYGFGCLQFMKRDVK